VPVGSSLSSGTFTSVTPWAHPITVPAREVATHDSTAVLPRRVSVGGRDQLCCELRRLDRCHTKHICDGFDTERAPVVDHPWDAMFAEQLPQSLAPVVVVGIELERFDAPVVAAPRAADRGSQRLLLLEDRDRPRSRQGSSSLRGAMPRTRGSPGLQLARRRCRFGREPHQRQ